MMLLNLNSTWQREWIGKEILALIWDDGEYVRMGEDSCEEIVAYSEPADNAYVLWFEARYSNGRTFRHNASKLDSVEIKDATAAGAG